MAGSRLFVRVLKKKTLRFNSDVAWCFVARWAAWQRWPPNWLVTYFFSLAVCLAARGHGYIISVRFQVPMILSWYVDVAIVHVSNLSDSLTYIHPVHNTEKSRSSRHRCPPLDGARGRCQRSPLVTPLRFKEKTWDLDNFDPVTIYAIYIRKSICEGVGCFVYLQQSDNIRWTGNDCKNAKAKTKTFTELNGSVTKRQVV